VLPVLSTHIRALPKYLPRIMTGPKDLQKFSEINQPGIIFNLYSIQKNHIRQASITFKKKKKTPCNKFKVKGTLKKSYES
jgi:hypothetical protein